MNGELNHIYHPYRIRIFWAIVYFSIIVMSLIGLYVAAAQIRTHTLPTGQVQLTVQYSKYLVGEAVSFSIKNNYNSPIYIQNNCPGEPLAVYRQENGAWVRQHDVASEDECPSEQRQVSVAANGVVNGSFAPWHNLFSQPGKYRIVAFVEYYNALPYQEFEVVAKPAPIVSAPTTQQESTSSNSTSAAPTNQTIAPTTTKQSKTVSTRGGSISVQYDTLNVYVISITPAAGCTYEGGASGRQVQVQFNCAGSETQVQLSVSGGQLIVKIDD